MILTKLQKTKNLIGSKIRSLREARRLTQQDLAERLGITQGRLSALERGKGSFTAEQFLEVLTIFNVPASEFQATIPEPVAVVQNALVNAGARHLAATETLPSERLRQIETLIRETLLEGDPRQVAALAPVLASNVRKIDFVNLIAKAKEIGLDQRLFWVLAFIAKALQVELQERLSNTIQWQYRAASHTINTVLTRYCHIDQIPTRESDHFDQILNHIGHDQIKNRTSTFDNHWSVLNRITLDDFLEALRAAR